MRLSLQFGGVDETGSDITEIPLIAGMGKDEMKQTDMLIKSLKRCSLGIAGIFLLFAASSALAEEWSQRYTESLPDSSFAAIEITKMGRKFDIFPIITIWENLISII